MSNKIQMTEEQYIEMMKEYYRCPEGYSYFEHLKEQGYIKKSDLELARDNYIAIYGNTYNGIASDYIKKLEEEIERLKND